MLRPARPAGDGPPDQSEAIPRRVQQAFVAAEDQRFWEHGGIDPLGILRALMTAAENYGRGRRMGGASTITQQVAKNLLLTNELSYTRKIRELFLARRMEAVLTKQQILELYLNQIFLGRNAYGIQAAARAYFDKDVAQLTLPEAAYLAVLPKAPANYDPVRETQRALGRRNYVLREMYRNGYITEDQWKSAAATPLGTIRYGAGEHFRDMGGYYMEAVRRELLRRFGEPVREFIERRLTLVTSVAAAGIVGGFVALRFL